MIMQVLGEKPISKNLPHVVNDTTWGKWVREKLKIIFSTALRYPRKASIAIDRKHINCFEMELSKTITATTGTATPPVTGNGQIATIRVAP